MVIIIWMISNIVDIVITDFWFMFLRNNKQCGTKIRVECWRNRAEISHIRPRHEKTLFCILCFSYSTCAYRLRRAIAYGIISRVSRWALAPHAILSRAISPIPRKLPEGLLSNFEYMYWHMCVHININKYIYIYFFFINIFKY